MKGQGLAAAASDFCREELLIRAAKSSLLRCTNRDDGDHTIGDWGIAPCDADTPVDDMCDACKKRFAGLPAYRGSLRRRNLAKARMLRAFRRLEAV